MDQISRIEEMEKCLDLSAGAVRNAAQALDEYEAALKAYKKLSDYYGSDRWMKDYEDDEAGRLPAGLKRGVLSEDAVYDLIQDFRALQLRMMKLVSLSLQKNLL